MNTELIITDITRMAHDFICVAGIDKSGKTIRPYTSDNNTAEIE